MKLRIILCITVFSSSLLFASNGAGYGGGESPVLKTSYIYLGSVLQRLRLGVDRDRLGNAEACSKVSEPAICRTVAGLNEKQKKQVASFLIDHLEGFTKTWSEMRVSFTAELILVSGPNGEQISVAAKTKLDSGGEVIFNEGSIHTLSSYGLVALVAHELGHKQKIEGHKGGYLQDNEPFGEFSGNGGGRAFLDALGSVVALYAIEHEGQVPVATVSECKKDAVAHLLKNAVHFGESQQRGIASVNPGEIVASQRLTDFFEAIHSRDFTLSVWVKGESDASGKPRLILSNIDYESKIPHGLELAQLKNGHLGVVIGEQSVVDTGAALTGGQYHLAAVRRKDDEIAVFFDGKKIRTITAELPKLASQTHMYVGRAAKPAAGFWEGTIPLATVSEKAFTDAEMKAAYQCPGPQ